ncbi:MAG: hypothetical protein LBG68_04115 [Coriobacteriales bacterium]|jgi:hypothetical protein|nr:hypothetical protein [Coriobacteriales bacterium]
MHIKDFRDGNSVTRRQTVTERRRFHLALDRGLKKPSSSGNSYKRLRARFSDAAAGLSGSLSLLQEGAIKKKLGCLILSILAFCLVFGTPAAALAQTKHWSTVDKTTGLLASLPAPLKTTDGQTADEGTSTTAVDTATTDEDTATTDDSQDTSGEEDSSVNDQATEAGNHASSSYDEVEIADTNELTEGDDLRTEGSSGIPGDIAGITITFYVLYLSGEPNCVGDSEHNSETRHNSELGYNNDFGYYNEPGYSYGSGYDNDSDLVPADLSVVAVLVSGLESGQSISYKDSKLFYSPELTSLHGLDSYLLCTSVEEPAADISASANYLIYPDDTSEQLVFGDTDGNGIVNAQDALEVTAVWLRGKPVTSNSQILAMNVNGRAGIDTYDVLAIIEHYISGTEFEVMKDLEQTSSKEVELCSTVRQPLL